MFASLWRRLPTASPSPLRTPERGFALPEVLVAAIIAAGVAIAAAQSLGMAARATQKTERLNTLAAEAEIIGVRLNAGIEANAALDGFDEWRLRRTPYGHGPRSRRNRSHNSLAMWTLTHEGAPAFELQMVRLAGE